jgi:ADP-ribosylglycohydrolase
MFITKDWIRSQIVQVIAAKQNQGYETEGLLDQVNKLPDTYDALFGFAESLPNLPYRAGWQFVEPDDLTEIWAECDSSRSVDLIAPLDLADSSKRVEAAFLGSVCGCILGKPLEIRPTLYEIRHALQQLGEWPLDDYISEKIKQYFDRPLHPTSTTTVRERIQYAEADDDVNYTILGMLMLEEHGLQLNRVSIRQAWLNYLPPGWTFGPERVLLTRAAFNSIDPVANPSEQELKDWVTVLNPKDEFCGAMIRADAYGYACPGRPALAAELAWRDASWTHRKTGIYGTMFMAAAIAAAQVLDDSVSVIQTALQYVPQRSRFFQAAAYALEAASKATDWIDSFERIHNRYSEYGHCRIFQETGTLINTLLFAESVGDGICKQVSQGNDTDSYGASAGSLLGAFFGPGYLEERWLTPFNDQIRTGLGGFTELSLSTLAHRMGQLPIRVAAEIHK